MSIILIIIILIIYVFILGFIVGYLFDLKFTTTKLRKIAREEIAKDKEGIS